MLATRLDKLRDYFSSLYGKNVEIHHVGELNKEKKRTEKDLKGFQYGVPYLIEFSVNGEAKSVVLETMKPEGFGHDYFSDRAQILLWQHSAFNKLPLHVHSVDVGAFTRDGVLKSIGDCTEFFILTEKVEGQLYHADLDRIRDEESLNHLDEARCSALADYLVRIHGVKKEAPRFYVRRIRDLVGQGEGIMGLIDSYPPNLDYISEQELCQIEKKCVEWRWKLKAKAHRCAQVHGDFHPSNIRFGQGTDFTVLDRSRGEWGEPADDTSAMSINYIFHALQVYGELNGPFERMFSMFWKTYLDKTGDEEMLTVIQPFYAWRSLVIASPIWYPNLSIDIRIKLFNFVKNIIDVERFDLKNVNSYIKE